MAWLAALAVWIIISVPFGMFVGAWLKVCATQDNRTVRGVSDGMIDPSPRRR